MSIGWDEIGGLRLRRAPQTLGNEFKDGGDLLPRHVELLHHFVNAQIFEILDNRGDR